jgi:hypothetical protein
VPGCRGGPRRGAQPGQPFGLQDLPDRLGGDRQALGGERLGDLGDAVVGGA